MTKLTQTAKRATRWALVGLLVWPLLAWLAAQALIVRVPLAHADALVVLSGSSAYVERTQRAAELWHAGRAPQIILTNDNELSGWSSAEQRNPLFVEREVAELKQAGVAAERIIVLSQPVASTYDEAVALRAYAAAHNLRSLQVVTSAYHSRRAWWALRRVFGASGIELGIEAVTPGEQTPRPLLWWLSARGWRAVAGEYLKFAYYLVQYR